MKVINIALVGFLLTLTTVTSAQREASNSVDGDAVAQPARPVERWLRPGLTLSFDPSLAALGDQAEPAIKGALLTWQETGAALPAIHFARGSGSAVSLQADGANTISYAPIEVEGHENDLAITITFANPSTGEIAEADVVINSRHAFAPLSAEQPSPASSLRSTTIEDAESCNGSVDSATCAGSYDLQNVLTHEFGHFFGLGEDLSDSRATMFSCTSACEMHKRDLEAVDVNNILQSYTSQPTDVAGCQAASWTGGGQWGAFRGAGSSLWFGTLLLLAAARRAVRKTPPAQALASELLARPSC